MHHSFDNDGYIFTPAYSTPSTGSLESVMCGTRSSSTPSPTGVREHQNYFENIKNRFSGASCNENEKTHKIAYSFDLFGSSGRLCGRLTPLSTRYNNNNDDNSFKLCGKMQLTIASLILLGLIEVLTLIITICAIIHSIKYSNNWDISGSIIGITALYTLSYISYSYGIYKKERKFLIPLIFQLILLFGAGCAAILIIIFTSFSDQPKNVDEDKNNKIFCVVLFFSVIYELACIIVSILLYRQTTTDQQ